MHAAMLLIPPRQGMLNDDSICPNGAHHPHIFGLSAADIAVCH
jgi:hypothetical protein